MIEGKLQTKKEWGLHLRTELASGTLGNDTTRIEVSLNVDNQALFVEIGDYVVTYRVHDMIIDALKMVEEKTK